MTHLRHLAEGAGVAPWPPSSCSSLASCSSGRVQYAHGRCQARNKKSGKPDFFPVCTIRGRGSVCFTLASEDTHVCISTLNT